MGHASARRPLIAEAAEGAGSARVRKVLAEVEAADAVKEAYEVDEFDST